MGKRVGKSELLGGDVRALIEDDAFDLAPPAGASADAASLALVMGAAHLLGALLEPRHEQLLDGPAFLDGRDLDMEVREVIDLLECAASAR